MCSIIKKNISIVLFLIAASFVFNQCGDKRDNQDAIIENEESSAYGDDRRMAFDNERDELISDLEDLKERLDVKSEELDSQIEEAEEDTVNELRAIKEEMQQNRSEIEKAIEDLENSSSDTWSGIKVEIENLHDRVLSNLNDWDDRIQNDNDHQFN